MKDGRMFAFGSSFAMEFFQFPESYDFSDVVEVINHSFVDSDGSLVPLKRGGFPPSDYPSSPVFRERVFFMCAIDGI
jgi:hypothetical protein